MVAGKRLTFLALIFALAMGPSPSAGIPVAQTKLLTLRGSVVRPNSRAARGVKVVLYTADPDAAREVVASVLSDRRGEFSLSAAADRRYVVVGSIGDERGEVGPFELTPATAPILIVLRPKK